MTKTFTENDLLRFAYGETSESENVEIKNALVCDQRLQEAYAELKNTLVMLEMGMLNPKDHSIRRVLDYSRSFNLPSVVK